MNSIPSRAFHRRALSILELLVVVTILAILAAFLIAATARFLERSRTVECANNLRQVGMLLQQYAVDRDNRLRFFRDGSGSPFWFNELRNFAEYSQEEAQKRFSCPAMDWRQTGHWWCYGMRMGRVPSDPDDPGTVQRDGSGQPGFYVLNLARVERPGDFWIMTDSATGSLARQTFRIVPPGLYSNAGVHLRHGDQANVLFLDGHVELRDPAGFYRLGMETVRNQRGQILSTIPAEE